MTTPPHDDLHGWIRDWQTPSTASPPQVHALIAHVQRRSRQIMWSLAAETVIGGVGLIVVTWFALTWNDPVERVAMATLAVVCAAALVFTWMNWYGTTRAVGESTAAYLDLSLRHLVRITRALRFGWALLIAETLVMAAWIGYRATLAAEPAWWPWLWLAGMSGSATVALFGAGRWLARENAIVRRLMEDQRDST